MFERGLYASQAQRNRPKRKAIKKKASAESGTFWLLYTVNQAVSKSFIRIYKQVRLSPVRSAVRRAVRGRTEAALGAKKSVDASLGYGVALFFLFALF